MWLPCSLWCSSRPFSKAYLPLWQCFLYGNTRPPIKILKHLRSIIKGRQWCNKGCQCRPDGSSQGSHKSYQWSSQDLHQGHQDPQNVFTNGHQGVPFLKKQIFGLSDPDFRSQTLLLPTAIHCWKQLIMYIALCKISLVSPQRLTSSERCWTKKMCRVCGKGSSKKKHDT